MLLSVLFLSFLNLPASAQILTPRELDVNADSGVYNGAVSRGPRKFSALKENLDVTLGTGATLYRLPEYYNDPSLLGGGDTSYSSCKIGAGRNAQLIQVRGDLALVRLHGERCSSDFNDNDRDPNLAFVKVSSLGQIDHTGQSMLQKLAKPICNLAKSPLKLIEGLAFKAPSTGVKDNADLDRYFSCYKTKSTDAYEAHYKKLIDLAGSVFNVSVDHSDGTRNVQPAFDGRGFNDAETAGPFVVSAHPKIMKCLIFRESGWNAGSRNTAGSGAMGLGQQTEVDVQAIKCLISGCAKKFKVGSGIVEKHVDAQPWARTLWQTYFKRARASMSEAEWRKLNVNPVTGAQCTQTMEVKERDANCPINSIAAVAIDQVAIEMMVRESTPKYKNSDTHDFNMKEAHELVLIYGSANDAGISKAAAAARSSGDIFSWARYLVENKNKSRSKELNGYYRDLSRCLNDGNFEPISGFPAKDCSDPAAH